MRSTKRMPLTTRPRSTSRQGMMRFASMNQSLTFPASGSQSLFQGEAVFIKRLADDHPVDAVAFQLAQLRDVFERADAARCGDARPRAAGDLARRFKVRAFQPAIARNVCVDDARD